MGANSCSFCSKNNQDEERLYVGKILPSYSLSSSQIFAVLKEQKTSFFKSSFSNSIKCNNVSLDSFEILKHLGSGASGKILLVRKLDSGKLYALKAINKKDISYKKQQEYAWNELFILQNNESPYIANLQYSFQNEDFLFLVMDFLIGGDLFFHLRKETRFSEAKTAFYAAEIICALEYLHENFYVYRDLKPENILFDREGHLKLVDFGLSKRININDGVYCKTIVGTPEYLAPEIILKKKYGNSVDIWNLGCVIYEMIVGKPPFIGKSLKEIYQKIVENEIFFNESLNISNEAKKLILGLLNKNPNKRPKISQLKKNDFFKNIDWKIMEGRNGSPPFIPDIKNEMDLKYFENRIVNLPVGKTICKEKEEDIFDYYLNFSFNVNLENEEFVDLVQ